jgi:tRNA G18 (ribose-2'-O)-methylase SpoU
LELHEKAKSFWSAKYEYPVALIVGNEVEGIKDDLLAECDEIIQIPMSGIKESLNVATATGIAVYEIMKPYIK